MARTKMNQRSASRVDVPMGVTGGRTPPSKLTVALLAVCALSALWALAMLMPPGRVAYYYFFAYSEFYMGVLSLVTLSITIMIGLVATDRLVLSIRQRVLLQSAHRTTGVIAVASLFVHVWTKVMEHHIRVVDVFVPFLNPGPVGGYIGLGTVSGWIMVLVMWSGLARSRFVGRGKPWMWRSLHAVSYLIWPIALVHGLSAGRPAKPWIIVSYIVCILLVMVGLAVRLSVSLNRRKDFSSTAASGGMKPVGKLVPTPAPAAKKPRRREQRAEGLSPVAVVASFQPAGGLQPVRAPPVIEPMEGAVVAPRRPRAGDASDEPTGLMPRRALDSNEDERSRGPRYAAEEEFE